MTADILRFGFGRNPSKFDERDFQLAVYIPRALDVSGTKEWLYPGICLINSKPRTVGASDWRVGATTNRS